MISKEQIQKNKERIRLKLEKERKRKEEEAKKKAEAKLEAERSEAKKKEKKEERESLAVLIGDITKEVILKADDEKLRVKDEEKKVKKEEDQKLFADLISEEIKNVVLEKINGIDGDKGDKGDSIKGDKGDFVKGDKGDKGSKGESIKGDKGDCGDDGKDADEEKIIKEVLKKIPAQETNFEEIEELQEKIDEIKEDIKTKPKSIYGVRGLVTLEAGSGISIDEDSLALGRPIINATASAGTVENLSAQCDGSTTVFTTTSNTGIIWLTLNGTMLIEGKEFTRDSATQITLTFAPASGEELYLKYI